MTLQKLPVFRFTHLSPPTGTDARHGIAEVFPTDDGAFINNTFRRALHGIGRPVAVEEIPEEALAHMRGNCFFAKIFTIGELRRIPLSEKTLRPDDPSGIRTLDHLLALPDDGIILVHCGPR